MSSNVKYGEMCEECFEGGVALCVGIECWGLCEAYHLSEDSRQKIVEDGLGLPRTE